MNTLKSKVHLQLSYLKIFLQNSKYMIVMANVMKLVIVLLKDELI